MKWRSGSEMSTLAQRRVSHQQVFKRQRTKTGTRL